MRILLSAFACDPVLGSEEGVGWLWAFHLAKARHHVTVLTRAHHRPAIERAMSRLDLPTLRFEYVDLRSVPFWMPGVSVYPHYFAWQWKAYFRARRLHRDTPFGVTHHITYGVFRNPSYLWLLGSPFVFGPVGGGERSPSALRASMSRAARWHEWARDLANLLPHIDPLWRRMLYHSARIAVRTEETRACLPLDVRARTVVSLENMLSMQPHLAGGRRGKEPLKLLYAGRLLPLKGIHLALRALTLAREQVPATFTIVGKGPEESRLREEVRRMGLNDSVRFCGWVPRSELFAMYGTHDALLFPSLHDSGGTVVIEAIAHGTPVVCLDIGGPAVTVDPHCAKVVSTRDRTEDQVAQGLAEAVIEIARMSPAEWEGMRLAALRRADFYSPERVISRVYGPLLRSSSTESLSVGEDAVLA